MVKGKWHTRRPHGALETSLVQEKSYSLVSQAQCAPLGNGVVEWQPLCSVYLESTFLGSSPGPQVSILATLTSRITFLHLWFLIC